MWTKAPQSI